MLRNWDQIKRDEPGREEGIFGDVPENLPGPLYARKVQRRAASTGFDFDGVPYEAIEAELEELRAARDFEEVFHELGDVLFAAVNVARKLHVDPELALRASAARFRGRVEAAQALATADGADWNELTPERQLGYYAQVRSIAAMSQIERIHARQILDSPRQPDGRGRARAALRRDRARGRARRAPRPASSRPPSCATAARRGPARASRTRSANVNGEIAEALTGQRRRPTRRRSTRR